MAATWPRAHLYADERAAYCQSISASSRWSRYNTDNHCTAFTVSIDHVDTTTGISAAGARPSPASKCVDPNTPAGGSAPSRVTCSRFMAKPSGVLDTQRPHGGDRGSVPAGRSEAVRSVLRDHAGRRHHDAHRRSCSRRREEWGLKVISIKELQDYCRQHDKHVVDCEANAKMPTRYGEFTASAATSTTLTGEHHVALVKGDIGDGRDLLCRVHSECLTGDVFGSRRCDCGQQLAAAMQQIEQEGRGVLLYMRQEGRGIGLINKLQGLRAAGAGLRHGRGERQARLRARPARILDRRTNPAVTSARRSCVC